VPAEAIPSPKIKLQRRLLFAPIPKICLEAQPTFKGLRPQQDLWISIPEELRSAQETCMESFVALSEPRLSKRTILGKNYHPNVHFVHPSANDVRTTPSIHIYPANAQLPADGFLSVHASKNLSVRTHLASASADVADLPSPPLPPSYPPRLVLSLAFGRTLELHPHGCSKKLKN
jgi:hypothetical protein